MELDTDRIDAAVLALLLLGLHDGYRAWKTFDWDAMNRLHEKGFISDPVGRAKSVVLTEDGQREAQRLFQTMFAKRR
jgi:DNA-binding PadR family transcriptional regulator